MSEFIFKKGSSLEEWELPNHYQIRNFKAIKTLLENSYNKADVSIVSSNKSKSNNLPVACFKLTIERYSVFAFVRDNYYDIKLVINSPVPIDMPYHIVHKEMSKDELEEEKEKYRSWHTPSRRKQTKEDLKDLELLKTDDWIKKWSGDFLIRENGRIYRAYGCQEVYCEGINKLILPADSFSVYEKGKSNFGCYIGSYCKIPVILENLAPSIHKKLSEHFDDEHKEFMDLIKKLKTVEKKEDKERLIEESKSKMNSNRYNLIIEDARLIK